MAARRQPARSRARARRSSPSAFRLPALEQRHLDLLGLALVALGVLLAFPLYLGWDGGVVGEGVIDGLRVLLGELAYAVPVFVVAAGAVLVLRPVLPAVKPIRAGALCLVFALALCFAAGTFGLGPGDQPGWWDADEYRQTGGLLGEGLLWLTVHGVGMAGTHVIAVFLLLAGILLLTGASIAGVVRATSTSVADTTRVVRTAVPTRRRESEPKRDEERTLVPPEPEDSEPTIVRSGRMDGTTLDGVERFPDLFDDTSAPVDLTPEDADEEPLVPVPIPVPPVADIEPEPELEYDEPEDEPEEEEDDEEGVLSVREEDLTPQGRLRASVTDSPDFHWKVPRARLLTRSSKDQTRPDTAAQKQTAHALIEALAHFKVDAKLVGTVAGPHITRYELRLAPGIKMSKVSQLKDDLAYALAAVDIRILAPIPGKTAVGVEVPNINRHMVHLGDVYQDAPEGWSPLTVWLGKDVGGKAIGADLAKMPHLLVAGTTGAGKSGCINAMLSSILLRATPHELRMVLVDPKQVELNLYESIPHLLTPVITNPRKAANALQNLVKEMESRYSIMSLARTRNLPELNRVREGRGEPALPYILCVIDELADLMMVAPADVEDSIIRLAQKARAVGIHLVLATQSPRVDVITGMIKANVPSRIAFAVSSQTDSRVILDQNGAESLLGQGDMLFAPVGSSRLQRIQGAYIDEPQIEEITSFWREQGVPELREELLEEVEPEQQEIPGAGEDEMSPDEDPLLEDAIRLVVEMGTASTSMLQRRLRLGYTRAGRLIDMLERRNVISGYEGSKPRQVLVGEGDVERFLHNLRDREGKGAAAAHPEPEPVAE
ncbi:MAG: DNA translocase FtsK [Solirubrobacteraceae bacterium]|nr:DNA translocase FtsK [Solirubrobacteraceae bacterium]